MKRLSILKKPTILLTLPLLAAGLFSQSSFADSLTPACAGDTIDSKFHGKYQSILEVVEGRGPVVLLEMELKEKSVVVTFSAEGNDSVVTQKAWTCKTQGADILVIQFPKKIGEPQEFESRVIALTDGNIVDLGESYSPDDIQMEKRMANAGDYRMSFYRRVTR